MTESAPLRAGSASAADQAADAGAIAVYAISAPVAVRFRSGAVVGSRHRPRERVASAVMLAEVIGHYFPKLVQMHNYSAANSIKQKMYNWSTLSRESPSRDRVPAS